MEGILNLSTILTIVGILVVLIAAWAHPMMPWLLSF